ncbi:ABC transporter G family member 37 [Hordeum vulgare]|nr:ABC transporter G family member 37 [Hordeum vulgare]
MSSVSRAGYHNDANDMAGDEDLRALAANGVRGGERPREEGEREEELTAVLVRLSAGSGRTGRRRIDGYVSDQDQLRQERSDDPRLSHDESHLIAYRLNYQLGSFPTSYPGIPISDSRLSVADLRSMVTKLQHRIESGQGRWLSKVARTMLINSSLSNLFLFLMNSYSLHETLHHGVAKYQSRLYWAGKGDKQKYHMVC